MSNERMCSHKNITMSCPECDPALIINQSQDDSNYADAYKASATIEDIEAEIIKAYEAGGFRGITHYVLRLMAKTGER